jgi:epoxyqueuosine reductase QueG
MPQLHKIAEGDDPMLAEHANWAIEQIAGPRV